MKINGVLTALVAMVMMFSCKNDEANNPEPDAGAILVGQLSYTWNLEVASLDDVDLTNAFPDMTLTVESPANFRVTNAVAPIWPASGTFEVIQETSGNFLLRRNDGVDVRVISISETGLVLSLQYTPPGSGRGKSVGGEYEFSFVR